MISRCYFYVTYLLLLLKHNSKAGQGTSLFVHSIDEISSKDSMFIACCDTCVTCFTSAKMASTWMRLNLHTFARGLHYQHSVRDQRQRRSCYGLNWIGLKLQWLGTWCTGFQYRHHQWEQWEPKVFWCLHVACGIHMLCRLRSRGAFLHGICQRTKAVHL